MFPYTYIDLCTRTPTMNVGAPTHNHMQICTQALTHIIIWRRSLDTRCGLRGVIATNPSPLVPSPCSPPTFTHFSSIFVMPINTIVMELQSWTCASNTSKLLQQASNKLDAKDGPQTSCPTHRHPRATRQSRHIKVHNDWRSTRI